MRRREFITLASSAAIAWPLAARGQQPNRIRRIGWMDSFREDDPNAQARVKAFLQIIGKLGWTIGGNLTVTYRWGLFDVSSAWRAAAEILNLSPDVVLCGGTPSALAMQQASQTVPVVFAFVTDPVGQGLITNLAHPSANIIGFSYFEPAIGAKWLELLKEIAPRVSKVSLMFNPVSSPYSTLYFQSIAAAARRFAVETTTELVREPAGIDQALARLGRDPGRGVIFSADAFLYTNNKLVIESASRHRLPAIYGSPDSAADGGLLYYCVDIVDLWRRATSYADRILRGEKPADLPVQQPTKFEMTINLKTARALGLAVPNTLLVSANEVFE